MLASTAAATSLLSFSSSNSISTSFPFVQRLSIPKTSNVSSPSSSSSPFFIQAKATTRRENRTARHERIRKKVEGTTERPRLCVFRSNKHLYVQVIDDSKKHTLASASTMQKPVSEEFDFSAGPTIVFGGGLNYLQNRSDPAAQDRNLPEVAKKVGEAIAKACLEKGIEKIAFDRGGYPYHGRIEALAAAAREHGLQF